MRLWLFQSYKAHHWSPWSFLAAQCPRCRWLSVQCGLRYTAEGPLRNVLSKHRQQCTHNLQHHSPTVKWALMSHRYGKWASISVHRTCAISKQCTVLTWVLNYGALRVAGKHIMCPRSANQYIEHLNQHLKVSVKAHRSHRFPVLPSFLTSIPLSCSKKLKYCFKSFWILLVTFKIIYNIGKL